MQRCFHVLHQLAKHFEVTAIIKQNKIEFLECFTLFPALKTVKVISVNDFKNETDLFSLLPNRVANAFRYRWYQRVFRGTTDSSFNRYYPLLKQELKSKKYGVVILENLDVINAVSTIRRFSKMSRIIYDTHNVGSLIAEDEVKKGIMQKANMLAVQKTESNLYKTVDAIFTCSKIELDTFRILNKSRLEGEVIPNGAHVEKSKNNMGVLLDNPKFIIFCGSLGYEPNIEGLLWFYNKIWISKHFKREELKLLVVGSGAIPLQLKPLTSDGSIIFTGTVEDVKPFYKQAAVAIVPLFSGSGTRLKILEAMGYGLPVLSTSKGAEGIDCKHGENILISDDENTFRDNLEALVREKHMRISLSDAAFQLVQEKYDWDVIGQKMANYINGEIA